MAIKFKQNPNYPKKDIGVESSKDFCFDDFQDNKVTTEDRSNALVGSQQKSNNSVVIEEKIKDIDTGKRYVKFFVFDGEDKSEFLLPRGDFFKTEKLLLDCGASYTKYSDFVQDLLLQEGKLKMTKKYTSLGWGTYEGKEIFKGFTCIGTEAMYSGVRDIEPRGNTDVWLDGVEKYTRDNPVLQLAIVVGFSPLLEGYLCDVLDSCLIIHLSGPSSKGKSTFAQLALSVFSNPNPVSANGLFRSWNGTTNSLMSILRDNKGFPVVFDELGQCQLSNLTDFVYSIANRKEKSRLNADATEQGTTTWATTIISTGEVTLLGKCDENEGLMTRVIELSFDKITEDAQSAEEIKELIYSNYGVVYQRLVEEIMDIGKERIVNTFNIYKEKLKNDPRIKHRVAKRQMQHVAVILLAVSLFNSVSTYKLNFNEIKEILIKAVVEQNKNFNYDKGQKVLEFLRQDIISNGRRYANADGTDTNKYRTVGYKYSEHDDGSFEVFYIPKELKSLLTESGLGDINTVLKLFESKGVLLRDKDHRTTKRTVCGNTIRGYLIRFSAQEVENES